MHWMILPFRRYFDFEGRSRRMEYWMFVLFNIFVFAVLAGPMFVSMVGIALDPDMAGVSAQVLEEAMMGTITGITGIGLGLYGLYALAAFIPNIAVTVRRLHDRDMSGWWYLGFVIAGALPIVGVVASRIFLVLMFLPGTEGPNRFGEDPKNPYQADVFA